MNKQQAEQIILNVIHALKLTTQERDTLLKAVEVLKAEMKMIQEVKEIQSQS